MKLKALSKDCVAKLTDKICPELLYKRRQYLSESLAYRLRKRFHKALEGSEQSVNYIGSNALQQRTLFQ